VALRPADMRRVEVAAEDSPADIPVAGDTRAVVDNQAGEGSPEVAADIPAVEDNPVAAGIPAAAVGIRVAVGDSLADSPAVAGIPVAEDIPAVVDNPADSPVAEEDSPVAEEDSRAAEADNSRSAAAYRRMSCRTWRRKCCRGLPGFRNWGRRSAGVYRTRYRISVREHYWRRIWGILSIAAFHLSIISITIHRENVFPADYV